MPDSRTMQQKLEEIDVPEDIQLVLHENPLALWLYRFALYKRRASYARGTSGHAARAAFQAADDASDLLALAYPDQDWPKIICGISATDRNAFNGRFPPQFDYDQW